MERISEDSHRPLHCQGMTHRSVNRWSEHPLHAFYYVCGLCRCHLQDLRNAAVHLVSCLGLAALEQRRKSIVQCCLHGDCNYGTQASRRHTEFSFPGCKATPSKLFSIISCVGMNNNLPLYASNVYSSANFALRC